MADEEYLRRYTELPSLIHMLTYCELTLLDPSSWDDKNDSFYLAQYKEKRKLRSVLALCFTKSKETYHHWRVFAHGSAGVCVTFKRSTIEQAIQSVPRLVLKDVDYLTVDEIKAARPTKTKLPFLKRFGFEPEREVRLLWDSKDDDVQSMPVPFTLSAITRITLSPWLHPSLSDEVKSTLKSIYGCQGLRIYRSTLISNAEWMKHGRAAT